MLNSLLNRDGQKIRLAHVLVCYSIWRRNDFKTLGKHILRKDEREICRGPNPAPQTNDNAPQTAGVCRHAPTVPQPSPYALRGEGAADPRSPFTRISFGRSRMGIHQ